jgi:hypothetical protein
VPAKNNLGNDRTGLAFKVVVKPATHPLRAPAVEWEMETVTMTADEALATEAQAGKEGPSANCFWKRSWQTVLCSRRRSRSWPPRLASASDKCGAPARSWVCGRSGTFSVREGTKTGASRSMTRKSCRCDGWWRGACGPWPRFSHSCRVRTLARTRLDFAAAALLSAWLGPARPPAPYMLGAGRAGRGKGPTGPTTTYQPPTSLLPASYQPPRGG